MGLLTGAKKKLFANATEMSDALNQVSNNGRALGILAEGFSRSDNKSNFSRLLMDVESAKDYLRAVENNLRTLLVLTQKKK